MDHSRTKLLTCVFSVMVLVAFHGNALAQSGNEGVTLETKREKLNFLLRVGFKTRNMEGSLKKKIDKHVRILKENPDTFALLIGRELRLRDDFSSLDGKRIALALEGARQLGPSYGRPLLREFEAVLRTTIHDKEWLLSHVVRGEGVELREALNTLRQLHIETIKVLAELRDTSLVPYISRVLPEEAEKDARTYYYAMQTYLLQAAEQGDPQAQRWLRHMLDNVPRAFIGSRREEALEALAARKLHPSQDDDTAVESKGQQEGQPPDRSER